MRRQCGEERRIRLLCMHFQWGGRGNSNARGVSAVMRGQFEELRIKISKKEKGNKSNYCSRAVCNVYARAV